MKTTHNKILGALDAKNHAMWEALRVKNELAVAYRIFSESQDALLEILVDARREVEK